ncbi:MAG: hypothetical protein JSR34_08520 [Proteobacteria bacterium]|nr:hypothetical protein [Pseudomonadota bacterium]
MTRLPRLEPLSWLLVAVAGWALACALIALAGFGGRWKPLPDDSSLAPRLPRLPAATTGSTMGPLDSYAQAYNHPLFFPDRKPAAAHVPGKGGGDDHPLDATLTSVIITPTLKMAIVQDPKTHQSLRVREGQSLGGAYSAWKLTDIAPRSATFHSDSQGDTSLDLRVFNGKGGEDPTRMGLTPQVTAGLAASAQRGAPGAPADGTATTDAAAPADAGSGNAGTDGSQAAATADANQAAADAANNASQTAQQQADEIRRRIEERRQQAQQAQPPQPQDNGNNP